MDVSEPLPKSLGELFSDATALMRAHLSTVFALSLPFVAVELLLREAASAFFHDVRRAIGPDPSKASEALAELGGALGIAVALLVASRIAVQMATAAATLFTRDALTGRVDPPLVVVRRALVFVPRVLVEEAIFFFLLGVVVVAPAVGILVAPFFFESPLAFLLALPVALGWIVVTGISLFLRVLLAPQLIVVEGLAPIAALVRSSRLMRANGETMGERPKFRVSILLLVYWALASSIQGTFLIPVLVIGLMQGLSLTELPPPLTAIPLAASIPLALVQVLANAVVLPLAGLLPTLFHADLLVRRGEPSPAKSA